MSSYYEKYLKYKQKYYNVLKKNQFGGTNVSHIDNFPQHGSIVTLKKILTSQEKNIYGLNKDIILKNLYIVSQSDKFLILQKISNITEIHNNTQIECANEVTFEINNNDYQFRITDINKQDMDNKYEINSFSLMKKIN